MNRKEVRDTLEKQLQLLSERSHSEPQCTLSELAELTKAMCNLVNYMGIFGCGQD